MEILESKFENPSECISIWLREVEKCGFQSFAYNSEDIDTIANDNSKINDVADDNDEDGFVIADTFCKINESDVVKYEREDGLDDSVGVKGQCSVFLKNGYELNGQWRNGKRHGNGLICGQPLEAKGVKVIWGKYVGKCTNFSFIFVRRYLV